mmetsp:Transcript_75821/g.158059  ORF Transcript_75821/g.158059 Transcript_75821/m.158059 type:complete len:1056 (+) Transcript_75821:103-3270(+)
MTIPDYEYSQPAKRMRPTGNVTMDGKAMDFSKWARPPLPDDLLLPGKPLVCMQVDLDYYTDNPDFRFSKLQPGIDTKVPILRMYAVTESGNSVLVHIHGFDPYFYVPCANEAIASQPNLFKESLEEKLKTMNFRDRCASHVLSVEVVRRTSLMGWSGDGHRPFFKVTLAVPSLVAAARTVLEAGLPLKDGNVLPGDTTYETNIPFALRYMIDRDFAGGGWVTIESFEVRDPGSKVSSTQLEIDVHFEKVSKTAVDMLQIAPIRVLSFDIECYNPGKGFPRADTSPVIQIAVYVKEQGKDERLVQAIWNLNTCSEVAGAEVFAFEREEDLLMSFRDFFQMIDPDIITGYNIAQFDIPYLLDRAEAKKINFDFARLGRIMNSRARKRSKEVQGREIISVDIDGRVVFDMLVVIQKAQKLSSYSLNAVSAEFLGNQKEDVHYSEIGKLHTGNADTRRRLAVYCLKDAFLPMQLMEKLLCMYNYIEMARVTGTPINFLLNRGEMIKVTSQLLRKARQHDYVMPTVRGQQSEDKFEGATVLEPLTGYYDKPIATLDFASLYPSIMMAHNLCFTTLLRDDQVSQLDSSQIVVAPITGCKFVKKDTKRGLLPVILEELLAARKRAKKAMAEAEDPLTKSVLNGRQLALKISANSVYGFTGAKNGHLPCVEISASVTAFGRTMIEHTKNMVEAHYTIQNGKAHDAKVIYGDTDSVFVKFGCETVAEAMEMGEEAADMVSKTFAHPIKLEFEKVYHPYLLMNKKRYAGLYWTNPVKYDKLDAKGIETVRRDNCGLVRHLVEASLRKVLIDKSIDGAISYVQEVISDLLQNKIDLGSLVITKSLGKGANAEDYAAKQAHVELAERMRARDPATAPGSGDRVPYVIVKGHKDAKIYEKSESPLFALENNLTIDATHYIEHQLMQPLLRIFGPILGDESKANSRLFEGAHTRKVTTSIPKGNPMAKFITKSVKCLGCRTVIKSGSLCVHCEKEKAGQVVIHRMAEFRDKEEEYNRLWTQCQRCQGSVLERVICSNSDCDIFYRRAKAKKDVEQLQTDMRRLAIDMSW